MNTDHVKMLYDIGELNRLFADSDDIDTFLKRIVDTLAEHLNAEVCSIYLYKEAAGELLLKATRGLNPASVNTVKMKLGEGLVGLCLQTGEAICEACGDRNPAFKFFPGTDEELFKSFLAVPIVHGRINVGVLVVQRTQEHPFHEKDIMALRTAASQLASMIENINILFSAAHPETAGRTGEQETAALQFVSGKSVSPGVAFGTSAPAENKNVRDLLHFKTDKRYSSEEFEVALEKTESQLESLQQEVGEKLSDAASLIFSAHLLMLKDEGFTGGMKERIGNGENPPDAVIGLFKQYYDIFSASESLVIREKIQDIHDLASRILDNLVSADRSAGDYAGSIIIAEDILPSELLALSAEHIAGIVLARGGVTSHVAILARSLNIPAVIVNNPALLAVPPGTPVLVDADQGNVFVDPDDDIIDRFAEKSRNAAALTDTAFLEAPCLTRDGKKITLMVNINLLGDIANVRDVEIDGIGLYRTEFPFIIRNTFPSEEEQYTIYRRLVENLADATGDANNIVTFRTLDIGGDKVLSYYRREKENNPFLGLRSIRFSLQHDDIFKQQLRAILRAGTGCNLRIMFPMISSLDEFLQSKDILNDCLAELAAADEKYNAGPAVGLMIEIPSAVSVIEDLALPRNSADGRITAAIRMCPLHNDPGQVTVRILSTVPGQTARTCRCRERAYRMISRSAVTSRACSARAVAAMIRSAGSP